MLDPYQLGSEAWVDDPSLWPEVEFPRICDLFLQFTTTQVCDMALDVLRYR